MMDAKERWMKILQSDRTRDNLSFVKQVPWSWVVGHEARAEKNHSQSLDRLNERGGLSYVELLCIMFDKPWDDLGIDEKLAAQIVHRFSILDNGKIKQGREQGIREAAGRICYLCKGDLHWENKPRYMAPAMRWVHDPIPQGLVRQYCQAWRIWEAEALLDKE